VSKINYNELFTQIPNEIRQSKGKGVKIAIFDSGIFEAHPDLIKAFPIDQRSSKIVDFTNSITGTNDITKHGTHLAGIIGARSENNEGLIGIAPECDLYIAKVCSDDNLYSTESISNALDWAVREKIQLINMSFSISYPKYMKIKDKLNDIVSKGISLIASAGSDDLLSSDNFLYPAFSPFSIAVGGINNFLKNKPNVLLDFIIPIKMLISCGTSLEELYREDSGSSMSTAIVTGMVALGISCNKIKSTSKNDVTNFLKSIAIQYSEELDLNKLKLLKFN